MDKQIRRLAYGLFALFGLLFLQVNYVQVVAADRLVSDPGNTTRLIIAELETNRGEILAKDGTVLAKSVPTSGEFNYLRRYPDGERYGHITGYYSFLYGTSELERAYNDYLGAHDESLIAQNFLDYIVGKPKVGASIVTTIDPKVQAAAERALGDRPGAVFAMEPSTGNVLALVSVPPYDPNLLSSHSSKEMTATWNRLNRDDSKPLLSKAENELYPPGSTFKLITAAAALENGFGPNSEWPNPSELDLPLTSNTLKNFGGEHCAGGASEITLEEAFTISCNVTFGEIGLELGPEKLQAQAEAFGFNGDVPFDVPWVEGNFPPPEHFDQNDPLVAFAAIGQDEVSANPMQMALVASAIANDGVQMEPRLVTEVRDPDGQVLRRYEPAEYGRPISSSTAADLTEMMTNVVDQGTGTAAQIPGISVAGKTGTAQHGTGEDPHAWFVSFAPADDPQVAVAVVVLDGGDLGSEATGGQVAAPIAKAVIEAALREKAA